MSLDVLLSRLQCVRPKGADKWVTDCPGHRSKSKSSLALRQLADGRVLLHCFGGCSTQQVLGAIGLEFADLYSGPARHTVPDAAKRRTWRTSDVIAALKGELHVALVLLSDVAVGAAPLSADRDRAKEAVRRITHFLQELESAG